METYVDKSKVSVKPVHKNLARDMIEKNHYSGKMSACRYTLGVFYKSDVTNSLMVKQRISLVLACYGFL